jgi:tetratricopeptide (TPR) repeat protein
MARRRIFVWMMLLPLMSLAGNTVFAQKPMTPSSPPPSSSTMPNPTMNGSASKPAEAVQPPSKQETKAIKAFRDAQPADADKKTQLGEDFIASYPQSRFRPEVVTWLARAYLTKGQVDKLQAEGDKELALTPNNPLSLALLGSNLARVVTASTPDLQKHLDQAEEYCKKSLEVLATLQKPADTSDEKFTAAKNETSGLAYSGLGTVAFRRGKFTDAISDLEQSVKLSGGNDPVDYYLLGKSNEASTNFSEALAAYAKCAAITSGMQSACKSSMEDMKAHGAVMPK